MQQAVNIDGRPALATFMDELFVPVDDPEEAALVKAQFVDRQGGVVFLVPYDDAGIIARAWDESQHPRDPAGSPTGGQFTGGGGGEAEAKPAGEGKAKKKTERTDFAKNNIHLDSETVTDASKMEKFLTRWNNSVDVAPDEFKKEFLGGVNGSMRIAYDDHQDQMRITGQILDENEHAIADYTREIDFDDNYAYSAYFQFRRENTGGGIGKKMLAGNVAMYQKLGLDKVKVGANIDVGGYAWARYGYVPTPESWSQLSSQIISKISNMQGRETRERGGQTYTPGSWDDLSSDHQEDIERAWMRYTYDEFLQSEIENWRESGQALEDAKRALADDNLTSKPEWAKEALVLVRESREEAGEPPIPFTDEQLINAIGIESYESRGNDGRDDLEFYFNDEELTAPAGYDPTQETLPGIEPIEPHELLSEDMRDAIEKEMVAASNRKAESDAADADPPDHLSDGVQDYQSEYWSSMSDRDKYRWAERNGELPEIAIEEEEEEPEEGELLLVETDEEAIALEAIRKLAQSREPKSLWAIADSKYGKKLLLNTSWRGVLDMRDKQTMDRFHAYVGRK
jgi:hypothetical protein